MFFFKSSFNHLKRMSAHDRDTDLYIDECNEMYDVKDVVEIEALEYEVQEMAQRYKATFKRLEERLKEDEVENRLYEAVDTLERIVKINITHIHEFKRRVNVYLKKYPHSSCIDSLMTGANVICSDFYTLLRKPIHIKNN